MPASTWVVPAALSSCAPSFVAVGEHVYPVSAGLRALTAAADHVLAGLASGEALMQLATAWAAVATDLAATAQALGVGLSIAGATYADLEAALVRLAARP